MMLLHCDTTHLGEDITRRPATTGMFVLSNFGKEDFWKDQNMFIQKTPSSSFFF